VLSGVCQGLSDVVSCGGGLPGGLSGDCPRACQQTDGNLRGVVACGVVKSCQGVRRNLSRVVTGCKRVVRGCHGIVRGLSGGCNGIVTGLSGDCQGIVTGLLRDCHGIVRGLLSGGRFYLLGQRNVIHVHNVAKSLNNSCQVMVTPTYIYIDREIERGTEGCTHREKERVCE